MLGAAEVTGGPASPEQLLDDRCPHQAPCHLLASASSVFVLPQSRGPSSTPLSSPSNRFCVTSLDPDTLPTVATLLMGPSCFTQRVGRAPSGVRGCRVGQGDESAYKPQSEGKHRPALGANPKGRK